MRIAAKSAVRSDGGGLRPSGLRSEKIGAAVLRRRARGGEPRTQVAGLRCLLGAIVVLSVISGTPARGQGQPNPGTPAANAGAAAPAARNFAEDLNKGVKRLGTDERDLLTSPTRARRRDMRWLLFGGAAAGLMVADHSIMEHNTLSPENVRRSVDFSDVGLAGLAGLGGALFVRGTMTGNNHEQEAGLLSAESAVNAFAASLAMETIFGRERPNVVGAQGDFFRGGTSFPSDHSAIAWSIASTIAHEYPGRMTKVLSYGLASAISVSRVAGNQHFPSDVLVGGAMGWLIAREMYDKRHDADLGGEDWGGGSGPAASRDSLMLRTIASPYVPLDSWIYPEIDRLAALGYVHSAFMGMRPWTRNECARLVSEAGDTLSEQTSEDGEARRLYEELRAEFSSELNPDTEPARSAQVESVYTRLMGISGQPLNDSYHFGQTLINDFGRPYQEGFDPITGFSGWANWGRVVLYTRGEYQHAPSAPGYSQSVQDLIAQLDDNPVQAAHPTAAIDRFTLLDTYALTEVGNWDFSFGKESLWWGPNQGGSLILSDNAEPIYMFRVARDTPFTLPEFLRWMGPAKIDAFMGKLSGNEFPPRPLFHGEKLSLRPTQNLEVSFSRTGEFGGVGRPLTFGALFNTYFGYKSSELYPAWDNPGQRNTGFDLSYRLPGLRNWLTVYSTLMARDEVTPLIDFFPVRVFMEPGFYLSRFPHIPHLDLRGEAVTTDPRNGENKTGQWGYWETFYHDNYTNKNYLMGDWIGRCGTGYQLWSTYHFASRTSLQFGYRHAQVDSRFLPHGGTLNDGSVKLNYQIGRELTVSAFVQYENWLVTALAPQPKNNVTGALEVTFWPRHLRVWW